MTGPNKGKGKAFTWLAAHVGYQGNDCLPWPFARDSRVGRGMLGYKGKHYWSHRLMCELAHGPAPTPKHQAAHNCGKGHYGCCNPRHLEWKTNSENQLDRRKNGSMLRHRGGSAPSISPEQIASIYNLRAAGWTQVAIAKHLGVSLGCVQYWLKYRADRGHVGAKRGFSADETAFLTNALADGVKLSDIAASLGRTFISVQSKAYRLKLSA